MVLALGAAGWLHPEWEEGFYPEDMPPEWRLAFYNTQFNCVFLSRTDWRQVATGEWEAWREDTGETFLFLLEGGDDEIVPEAIAGRALCLSADDARIIWFDGQSDLRHLSEELSQPGRRQCFLISRDGDLNQMERVRTLLGLLGMMD